MQQKIRHKIICITNRHLVQGDFLERIEQIAALDWADAVILREKDLTEEEYKELARKVSSICSQYEKTCILHTFADAAMELGYRKIHLPYSAFLRLDNKQRQFFQIIGVSTHTPEEAREAEGQGASYVTASHIFPTACKVGLAPRGLSYLRETVRGVSIPVYALGGIHPENAASCLEAGAAGVCMMSEFMNGDLNRGCMDFSGCV